MLASLFVALNSIYIDKVLPVVDKDKWKLTAYNNTNAMILFIPAILGMGELPEVVSAPEMVSASYWTSALVTGLFGEWPMQMVEGIAYFWEYI